MIRAMIGTVAVVAGFGVLERSIDVGAGTAGSCAAAPAYALLQNGEVLAVRRAPTAQAAVIATLSASRRADGGPARTEVTITGRRNGWARIVLDAATGDGAAGESSRSFGWVPADRLVVDTLIDGAVGGHACRGAATIRS